MVQPMTVPSVLTSPRHLPDRVLREEHTTPTTTGISTHQRAGGAAMPRSMRRPARMIRDASTAALAELRRRSAASGLEALGGPLTTNAVPTSSVPGASCSTRHADWFVARK
jgi:hypothetical protein